MTNVRKQLVFSILFLLSSIALWSLVVPDAKTDAPEKPAVVAVQSAPQVDGVWEQYAVHGCRSEFMARLDVRRQGDAYVAYPLDLSASTFPKHAYRSYDHKFENGVWTFKEDWDYGNVGEFVLKQTPSGEFRGMATSSQDGSQFETYYIRVAD